MDWQRTTVYTAEDGPYRLEVVRYPAGPRMWRISFGPKSVTIGAASTTAKAQQDAGDAVAEHGAHMAKRAAYGGAE